MPGTEERLCVAAARATMPAGLKIPVSEPPIAATTIGREGIAASRKRRGVNEAQEMRAASKAGGIPNRIHNQQSSRD